VPGEWYSPTQPIPSKTARIRSAGRERQRPHRLHAELKAEAKKIVSEYKTGPIYTPPVLMGSPDGPKGLLLVPGTNGGADWGGAAFDTETGILYVPSAHMPTVIALGKSTNAESTLPYVKQTSQWPFGPQGLPDPFKPPYSRLVAIDLNKGDILWSVANGDGLRNHPAFKGLNLPPIGAPGRLAALVTKSFVFMGEEATAASDCRRWAVGRQEVPRLRQEDRRDSWEMELPAGVSNAPMTYHGQRASSSSSSRISGRQYPASSSRWHCPDVGVRPLQCFPGEVAAGLQTRRRSVGPSLVRYTLVRRPLRMAGNALRSYSSLAPR
jgi:quinoprotein glucose dehydrogenase